MLTDLTCDQFRQTSAELALGVSSAEERATALVHLQGCASCRSELRELSEIADALTALTPPAEPPAGFESRVVASLGQATRPARWKRWAPRRAVVALAAAAAVVAGVGGWFAANQSPSAPAVASDKIMTGSLTSGGKTVGEMIVTTGDEGWMAMWVHVGTSDETVTCELRLRTGTFVTVGTFALSNGYGYWAAPLPRNATPAGAQLIGSNRVLAASDALTVSGSSKA